MVADGSVVVEVIVDQNGVYKGVKSIKNQFGGLEKSVKRLGGIIAGAFGAVSIAKFGKAAIDLGSDVQEVQNVVDTAFGDMAYKAEEFAQSAITQFGMSSLAAKRTASQYMAMASGMGVAQDAASDMSIALAGLTGDIASFYNITQEEAAVKIAGVFTGESEALKSIGVVMTEANLEAFALSQGITKSVQSMTQAEKVALRYNFVMDSLSLAQGDFAKTQDSWANQTRILSMQWQEFMSIIGQALITILKPLVVVLNQIVSYLITAANAFNVAIQAIFGGSANEIKQTQQNAEAVGDAIAGSVENQEALTDATKGTAKAQKAALSGFDEINKLSSGGSGGGGAGGAGALAIGGAGFDVSKTETAESGQFSEIQKILSEIGVTIRNIFNSEPIQVFVRAGTTLFGFFKEYVLTMLGDIKTNFSLTWGNIQTDLQGICTNLIALWTTVWSDFSIAVQTWGTPIIDSISNLFNSIWSTAIDPAVQLVVGAWEDMTGMLLELWNEHGAPLLNNIGEFVHTTIGLFQSIYDNVLEPIITPLLETLSWVWDKHLNKMVYALGDFIMTLVNGAFEIYNKFVAPIVEYLLEKLAPGWAYLSNLVIGVAGTIIGVVSDLAAGILEALTGIIDFIVGVFTGDWEKAWDGVKSVFKGIWDGLTGIVKGVLNLIIDALNSFVAGINKIRFDVPDWVPLIGGMKWGFNIPKIPKLAQGAVIPPNREFMAVLGDQKSGTNIETPLETMVQAFRMALSDMGGGQNEAVMVVDDEVFARLIYKLNGQESKRIGVSFSGG